MKNTPYFLLAVFVTLWALFGVCSCSLTPQEKATLESNLVKDGTAALAAGMATGSWQGAALGAGAQVVRNHTPVTAAKQPTDITP